MSIVDEMEELRKANPVSVEEAGEFVAMRRGEFADAVEGDRLGRGQGLPSVPHIERHPRNRSSLVAGIAAAIVLIFVGFTVADRLDNRGVIEASVAAPMPEDDGAVLLQSGGEPFDRNTDLLVVHLDYAERSDGHAAVAAREAAVWFDVEPVVVAGTQAIDSTRTVHEYVPMMDAAWGTAWLDATLDRSGALEASLERWISTLERGGQVWVAEGGVSDFTAELVREIARQHPDVSTKASIHVVQHHERSETESRVGDVPFLESAADYKRIEQGNADNGTANFTRTSDGFQESVLSGCHSDQWAAAFEYLAAGDLDFSDTILIMDILGVGLDQVATADDFADFFIGDQPDAKFRGEG